MRQNDSSGRARPIAISAIGWSDLGRCWGFFQIGQRRDLGLHRGFCGRHVRGPVQQRLAAQATGDVAGFADGCRGGVGVAQAGEMPGVVEQAVGEVVGGAQLAQAG